MTEKFLMARNFFRIFTENNPVMGYSKTFCIPEAKGLKTKSSKFYMKLTWCEDVGVKYSPYSLGTLVKNRPETTKVN